MANCENCIKAGVCKYYEPKSTVACEHYVKSVINAYWIPQFVSKRGLSKHFVCSECAEWVVTAHKVKMIKSKYCPNCGAKMFGKDNV